ncbi:uncharacterized protein LY89DRAFT_692593 [Mollisia scopiformis]|uniref:Uncharacterized protein n=1 Tax=Mollisia scopiformis TaxID=149040 RepID=A0A132B1J8_MOLSC|nr:uncharacterized protein LY89DRAFT_692593 [Mollisia scopiformis]KUJ06258.1 hypothetical protein LY89DRAFT_692593 [Mollisia scopiformis]
MGHNPKFVGPVRQPPIHKSGPQELLDPEPREVAPTMKTQGCLDGEKCASTIQWDKYNFNAGTCESNGPIYPADQARVDFVKMIDEGAQLEYCSVCEKTHICPGPPITLPDRDTCGAFLPRWFPKGRFPKPWATYLELMSDITTMEAFKNDPKAVWDKYFHKADDKWESIGREDGGWWKCRVGSDASWAELECTLCHRARYNAAWEQEQRKQRRDVLERLKKLKAWKAKHEKECADRDKAVALAMIRDGPPPMALLTPLPAEPVPPLKIPYDSDDGEGDWTMGPYAGQIVWKAKPYNSKPVIVEKSGGSESQDFKADELTRSISALDLHQIAVEHHEETPVQTFNESGGEVKRGRSLTRKSFSSTSSTRSPNKLFFR